MSVGMGVRHEDGPTSFLPCVSAPMQALAASIRRVAVTDVPVLLCGETGVGKSVLAEQVYRESPRRVAPLTILYGATATVAMVDRLAQLGDQTVLLEEVGELAPAVQDSLVRLLGTAPQRGTLRLISTTSRDLAALTERQGMRADLRYRLDVVRLEIPPLRQRPDDIVVLAEHFLGIAARHFRRDVRAFGPEARVRLLEHSWVGNVRELRNCVFESMLHCAHMRLRAADLRIRPAVSGGDAEAELVALLARLHAAHPQDFHRYAQQVLLRWALDACGGNRVRAAALLGIGRGALRARLRRYGMERALGSELDRAQN